MAMESKPPPSPFALTPTRIMLLVMVAIAALFAISAVFGGLSGYQALRDSAKPAAVSPGAS